MCGSPGDVQHCAETTQSSCDRKVDTINLFANENHITGLLIKLACLLLPLAWVSWNNSPTLAVAASKLDIYQMLCVQF
jgi:hypothetical protein